MYGWWMMVDDDDGGGGGWVVVVWGVFGFFWLWVVLLCPSWGLWD